jgi:hypothetical protein
MPSMTSLPLITASFTSGRSNAVMAITSPFFSSSTPGVPARRALYLSEAQELFLAGWFFCFRGSVADDAHGDCCDPADNFCLGRVLEDPNVLVCMRVRDHHQPPAVNLAPAAYITIA